MPPPRKRLIASVVALLTVVGLGLAPAARGLGPGPPGVSIDNPTPAPGETFTISIVGCPPIEDVLIVVNSLPSKARADSGGQAQETRVAPDDPGTYDGSVVCNGLTTNFQITVQVETPPEDPTTTSSSTSTGDTPAPTSTDPPTTQAPSTTDDADDSLSSEDVALGLLVLAGLLTLALIAVLLSRRRQSGSTPT